MSADFIAAVKKGDREGVERMLAADPGLVTAKDEHGVSAISLSVYHGRYEVMKAILARRPALDVFEAAAVGDADRTRELVSQDPVLANAWSPDGFFPLGLAAFFKHPAVAKVLLEHGADATMASRPAKFTPLHSATSDDAGQVTKDLVQMLLDANADPNARSASDGTPLHSAAFTGDVAVMQLLLAYGADATAVDNKGHTPLDIARDRGHSEIAALLHHSVTNRRRKP